MASLKINDNLTVAGGGTVGGNNIVTDTGKSWATNGYCKLSNGLVIQWGTLTSFSNPTTVNFPTAFPTNCLVVICCRKAKSTSGNDDASQEPKIQTFSATTFQITCNDSRGAYWIAVGY